MDVFSMEWYTTDCKTLFTYFCTVTAYDLENFAVTWQKDGRTLYLDTFQYPPKDPRLIYRISDSSLVINNITASDSGHYNCSYSSKPRVELIHVINVYGKRNRAVCILRMS
jgi:hypothetical protein